MSAGPRVVLDTNVVVSAFLWEGKLGRLIALAGEGDLRLFTSRALLDEVSATLAKPKLAKSVIATGLTAAEMIAIYRRLVTVVRVAPLGSPISRDPDDDKVIACALAARAACIVSGDEDLLVLRSVVGIAVHTVADALRVFEPE